jgi:hypothetical protein
MAKPVKKSSKLGGKKLEKKKTLNQFVTLNRYTPIGG